MESILNETWGGSEPAPPQWVDYLLMKRMRWSWAQLQETPVYVQRFCLDFLGLSAEAEQARHDKAKREAEAKSKRR
ncbi:hypothetical protein [Streptacidiphilus sp. EB129]|uniref:hypothetical protein n=1 Tax=Streptacidiphilus sp. EB129 TaxID=3156262 RepID=UPI003518B381